jgi:hypothetical protein
MTQLGYQYSSQAERPPHVNASPIETYRDTLVSDIFNAAMK